MALDSYGDADAIVTNPPYTRPLMRALIGHLVRILPTWLLLETDWAFTISHRRSAILRLLVLAAVRPVRDPVEKVN